MDEQNQTSAAKSSLAKAATQSIMANLPVFALYLMISLIVFWPITTHLASTTVNGAGDLYQNLWNLWWVNYATYTLHTSIYFTPMLYYPVGASLVTQTLSPISAYISFPFQAVSLVFAYNVMLFLAFALCGLFTYLLAMYLTNSKYASIIAGFVFAFAPMHMAQALGGHLNWTNVEFLPLFTLFFIQMVREKKIVYSLGAALSFVFMLFMGDPEQGIISVVFAFFLLLVLLGKKIVPEITNMQFLKPFGAMIILIIVIGSPFLLPISSALTNGTLSQAASALNDVNHNMLWSMPMLSFFAPSMYNNLFSWLSNSYSSIYTVDPVERVSYLGYVALILALIGVWSSRKEGFKSTMPWIVGIVIFGWLSLGPYIQLSNLPAQPSGIPGIYLAYKALPFFNIIREPARFDMIVTLALAILCAYGFKEVMENHKRKNLHNLKKEQLFALAISALIILEYAGIPITSSYINSFYQTTTIPNAYAKLGAIAGNFSVLTIPAIQGSGDYKPELYVGMSMYYQTAFKKPIISGYTSRVNETELLPSYSVPIAVSASYLQQGQGLIYPSPIIQDQTNMSNFWLANYHTAFIAIIRQAFNNTQLQSLGNYLVSVYGQPIFQDNTTVIFSTANATAHAGQTLISYTAGTWVPGLTLCQTQFLCNSTFNALWWGPRVRAIDIYSPKPQVMKMRLQAVSYQGTIPLYFYLNSFSTSTANVTLGGSILNYSVSLALNSGINQLFLVTPNTTATASQNPLLTFGIKNITISQK